MTNVVLHTPESVAASAIDLIRRADSCPQVVKRRLNIVKCIRETTWKKGWIRVKMDLATGKVPKFARTFFKGQVLKSLR